MSASPPNSNRPFFIVGAGRSGTTLLRLMLSGHSRLHVSPETWFLRELLERLPVDRALDSTEREWAIATMVGHYRWPDLGVTETRLRASLAGRPSITLRDLTDAVYAFIAEDAGKARLGDKTPVYVQILPQLAALYPDAQFIYLLRDGRDVALSYIDAGWGHRCYEGEAFEWTAAVRAARAFAKTVSSEKWLEIRYEDMVRTPEPVVRRLCAFLGEAFEPAMMDFASRADLVPKRERGIHPRVSGAVDAGRAGAWQSRLSAGELFVLESCLGKDLRNDGYALRYAASSWKPALGLARATLTAAAPALLRILPALHRRGLLPKGLLI